MSSSLKNIFPEGVLKFHEIQYGKMIFNNVYITKTLRFMCKTVACKYRIPLSVVVGIFIFSVFFNAYNKCSHGYFDG
ncbi:hypothetical protein QW060_20870 [Myroides ceti]|uniref:Uncharacterized protein n=1 Tax=Paenimyroides ceti TaxID=395087 RepID=A0ABT8CYT8_9FLAO|nr:hypothetical protein [Paenimyroides ceti]MDN3709457.1 hypothetical protein [Paenimyroides ceti]